MRSPFSTLPVIASGLRSQAAGNCGITPVVRPGRKIFRGLSTHFAASAKHQHIAGTTACLDEASARLPPEVQSPVVERGTVLWGHPTDPLTLATANCSSRSTPTPVPLDRAGTGLPHQRGYLRPADGREGALPWNVLATRCARWLYYLLGLERGRRPPDEARVRLQGVRGRHRLAIDCSRKKKPTTNRSITTYSCRRAGEGTVSASATLRSGLPLALAGCIVGPRRSWCASTPRSSRLIRPWLASISFGMKHRLFERRGEPVREFRKN